jgi:predicted acylesterase/phospholipase RssA
MPKPGMPKLRIGLTISGAVSLGSYEGGALAALLVAVQELKGEVVIDALTGASAGAITAVLAARCLTRGADPVKAMTASWVDLPDINSLKTHEHTSPLSSRVLADGAKALLAPGGLPEDAAKAQPGPVHVSLTMASLEGFRYEIKKLEGDTTVDAVTYVDWAEFHFTKDSADADWLAGAEASLASAANAVGFPPKLVTRSDQAMKDAEAQGLVNVANPAWFTDGGTIDNEPMGRLLDMLGDDDAERLVVLVHPTPTSTPAAPVWVDSHQQPRWTRTGLRAQSMRGDQSIYDDLRKLEKTNTRIVWTADAMAALAAAIEGATDGTGRAGIADALRHALGDLHDRKAALNEAIGRAAPAADTPPDDAELVELLTALVHRATGLEGKRPVRIEVVSPDLDDSGKPADELLAGEKLGHFFGFVDAKFRKSDFALGYRNMTTFLEKSLGKYGVAAEVAAALPEVHRRYQELAWDGERWGGAGWGDLSLVERARLLELGGHVAWLVQDDVRHWDKGLPVEG